MKILFCANIYEKAVVGPVRFAEMLLKINDWYKGVHEVKILTADTTMSSRFIYKMNYEPPKFFQAADTFTRGYAFYKNLKRVQKEFDFEVVIFGGAMYGLVPKLLWNDPQVKMVGLINDYLFLGKKWSSVFQSRYGHYYYTHGKIESWAAQKLDLVLACSNYLRQEVILNHQINPQKVFKLYHTCDLEKIDFQPSKFQDKDRVKILFVKYLYQLGGLEDLAAALQLLRNQKFELTIIGPTEVAKPAILSMFENATNVELNYIGKAPPKIVYQAMSKNDILCVPSHFESLGITNIEGLAHGIAVVSTNEGGIPEVLDRGKNGWLAEKNNPASLKECLENCIQISSEERLAMAKRGREYVEKHFDARQITQNLLEILAKNINIV